ncbi:hypothetical protein X566_20240 [Afipia sp. P52-10]|uniref:hypothetical protein n=1 Tax=Afipia sp. P52-10 TaxID=1429916 RepID=UPI0003DEF5FB|nr:hypothetical protein [Afipia sp. P52-10]ETR75926.1 hypothetical protein X566_20240 [Afipia sp. P52-10]
MAANWSQPLSTLFGPRPVETPDGRLLRTLADARAYANSLPAHTTDNDPHWQHAAGILIWAAETPAAVVFTHHAVKRAVYGGDEPAPIGRMSYKERKAAAFKEKRRKAKGR